MTAIEDVRRELTETRLRMDATAAELESVVSGRIERAKEAVDPRHYAREYPWLALGVALGVGLAIGLTGADRAAAAAVADGAKKAAAAVGDGAVSAKDAIVERFQGDGAEPFEATAAEPAGVRGKLRAAVDNLLYD